MQSFASLMNVRIISRLFPTNFENYYLLTGLARPYVPGWAPEGLQEPIASQGISPVSNHHPYPLNHNVDQRLTDSCDLWPEVSPIGQIVSPWSISDHLWTIPELLAWDIPEVAPWSTHDLSTASLPESATWPILEATTWSPQQPAMWSTSPASSLLLPEPPARATADPAQWTVPDPLIMLPRSQTQTSLPQQQAVGAPVCEVNGRGRSSQLLQGLDSHIREPHQGQLFCPQPGCMDRRIWPDVVSLYVHAKSVHLNDNRYWCHICYHTGDAPAEIQLHVDVNHWHHDVAFEVRRIEAEWHRRRFPI